MRSAGAPALRRTVRLWRRTLPAPRAPRSSSAVPSARADRSASLACKRRAIADSGGHSSMRRAWGDRSPMPRRASRPRGARRHQLVERPAAQPPRRWARQLLCVGRGFRHHARPSQDVCDASGPRPGTPCALPRHRPLKTGDASEFNVGDLRDHSFIEENPAIELAREMRAMMSCAASARAARSSSATRNCRSRKARLRAQLEGQRAAGRNRRCGGVAGMLRIIFDIIGRRWRPKPNPPGGQVNEPIPVGTQPENYRIRPPSRLRGFRCVLAHDEKRRRSRSKG